MTDLHAVFRSTGESWEAYSRPVSIHAGGRSRDLARDEFYRAARSHFDEDWDDVEVHDHVERQVAPGVFARTAVDRFTLRRDHVESVLRRSLTVPEQLSQLRSSGAEATTGDFVFVCCVTSDRISWIVQQLGRTDSLQVCVAGPDDMVWWTTLAAPDTTSPVQDSETLGEAGLGGDSATVADLIRRETQRRDPFVERDVARSQRSGSRRGRPTMQARGRTLVASS